MAESTRNHTSVLFVGLCCVDIICETTHYPIEDSDQRCVSQTWQRGGNAANNSTVFSLLGGSPAYAGNIADSQQKSFLINDFNNFNIDLSYAKLIPEVDCPTSCVILSQATGSRTIIHSNRNLPEFTLQQFKTINLKNFKWIHFEGRNAQNVKNMINYVREFCTTENHKITVSVEIEKSKPELAGLIPLGDVIFVSKDYARYQGYRDMDETLDNIRTLCKPSATIICPWGEKGASGIDSSSDKVFSPAYPPEKVLDTLGAGDTFIASTIFGLSSNWSLVDSISFGCKIAGLKVGLKGWDQLKKSLCKDNLQGDQKSLIKTKPS